MPSVLLILAAVAFLCLIGRQASWFFDGGPAGLEDAANGGPAGRTGNPVAQACSYFISGISILVAFALVFVLLGASLLSQLIAQVKRGAGLAEAGYNLRRAGWSRQ